MGRILYLECNSGISGDMTVGALLDLGADRQALEKGLASLGVDGYHLHFGRKTVCGLDAFDFDVHLEENGPGHGTDIAGHEAETAGGEYVHSHEAAAAGHGHVHSHESETAGGEYVHSHEAETAGGEYVHSHGAAAAGDGHVHSHESETAGGEYVH
ncbi:MAG: LarC family nickel insertion protein, partial [Clostridium sp.]|nr:LarC family nickel insertion protein [Clostridium sp.]